MVIVINKGTLEKGVLAVDVQDKTSSWANNAINPRVVVARSAVKYKTLQNLFSEWELTDWSPKTIVGKGGQKRKICGVPGCVRRATCSGFCGKHWYRLACYGEIEHEVRAPRNFWNSHKEEEKVYEMMKNRCLNKNSKAYKYYGARGIKICDEWLGSKGPENFLRDMGSRPRGTTLDRIDVNGDYCKENCRWTTWDVQTYNRRPQERSNEIIGVMPITLKSGKTSYISYISSKKKSRRKQFKNLRDAILWRATEEFKAYGVENMQAVKIDALLWDCFRKDESSQEFLDIGDYSYVL